MSLEIERKFLVNGDFKQEISQTLDVVQGYLSSIPHRSVRVRIMGAKGFLTIKGIGDETGVSRFEWEKEIAVEEARLLIQICEPGVIEKKRHLVNYHDHLFEVDEFLGDNAGLIVAEIELDSADEHFDKPTWLGNEVTGIEKYYNAALSRHPFKTWE